MTKYLAAFFVHDVTSRVHALTAGDHNFDRFAWIANAPDGICAIRQITDQHYRFSVL
jgi:hypothetical protein